MLYAGPRQQLVPWMSGTLGYGPYCPERYGMAADWVMDLVNVGFRKPQVRMVAGVLGKCLALLRHRAWLPIPLLPTLQCCTALLLYRPNAPFSPCTVVPPR